MTKYANSVGLLIGVPLSGAPLVPEFTWSFMSLNPGMNFNIRYCTVKNKPVDEARNFMAEEAIREKCEFLFFVDEDVTMPPHTLRQMLTRMSWNPSISVLSGIYCHKQTPPQPMIFRGNGAGPYWDWHIGEVFQISGCGMGCCLIRTDVFSKIEKPWFKTVDDASKYLDGQNSLVQYTEDLWFLEKVNNANLEIWADGGILCEHWDLNTMKATVLPPDSPPYRRLVIPKGKKKILEIGAGEEPYKTDEGEVLTFDIREAVNPDYRGDARLLPFGTGEFDIVFSSHCLEHFQRDEWERVLHEWLRVMKPTGEFRLVVPNVEWALEKIQKGNLSKRDREHVLNVIYGAQTYDYNHHGMGFTPSILRETFEDLGYEVNIELEAYNIYCKVTRPASFFKKPVDLVPSYKRQLAATAKPKSKRKVK